MKVEKKKMSMGDKYDVKVKQDHDSVYLSVTHNGYQWTSISIKDPDKEIPLIIKALTEWKNE